MKKICTSIMSLIGSTLIFAQGSAPETPTPPVSFDSYIQVILPLFAIGLVVTLIIQVTRYILEFRLKNKIIDRGISEHLASSLLEKSSDDKKEDSIKWAFLLLGLSGGLIVTYYTMPLDIHSLAIIAFSIGLSFLAYYFFLKNSKY